MVLRYFMFSCKYIYIYVLFHFGFLSRWWCLNTPTKKENIANFAFWAVLKTLITSQYTDCFIGILTRNHENPYLIGYNSIISCIQQITNMAKLLQFLKPELTRILRGPDSLSKNPPIFGGTPNRQGEGSRLNLRTKMNWKKCSSSLARKVGNQGMNPHNTHVPGNSAFVPFFGMDGEWVNTWPFQLTQRWLEWWPPNN